MSPSLLAFALLAAPPAAAEVSPPPDGHASLRYDPLAVSAASAAEPLDLTVRDAVRDRDIPVRVRLPASDGRDATAASAPVVLFSHGLGGSRTGGTYLAEHWAARGYVVVNLQHAGSDEEVWKSVGRSRRLAAMKRAASVENFFLRVGDVPAVLDQLVRWNAEAGHPLAGRLDPDRIGMSGHSFGAQTTQAVSGQTFAGAGARFTDPRIDAAVALSPSLPGRGEPASAFGSVAIPWLLMTGTADGGEIVDRSPESRRLVFPALPTTVDRYELVLDDAEHSAFADARLPGDRLPRDPNHHRVILALTTAFWDTHLRRDPAARAWLHGSGAKSVLAANDLWDVRPAAGR